MTEAKRDPGQDDPNYVYGEETTSGPATEEVTVKGPVSEKTTHLAVRLEYILAIAGTVIGFLAILGGILLVLLGVSGAVDFELTSGGVSAKISTSVVGVVIAVIGLVVIKVTRPTVKLEEST